MNKIKFLPTNEEINLIKSLEQKEKHFHFYNDLTKGINQQSFICVDSDKCPICNFINDKKKSFFFRLKIFYFDIIKDFKKLFNYK